MTRRGQKRKQRPPTKQTQRDLSAPNIGTSSTKDSEIRANNTDTFPRTSLEYEVSDEVLTEDDDGFFGNRYSIKELSFYVGGALMIGGVAFTSWMLLSGIGDVEEKIGAVGDDVSDVRDLATANANQLESLADSVERVEEEVHDTKELVNEIRVDIARKDDDG